MSCIDSLTLTDLWLLLSFTLYQTRTLDSRGISLSPLLSLDLFSEEVLVILKLCLNIMGNLSENDMFSLAHTAIYTLFVLDFGCMMNYLAIWLGMVLEH